MADSHAGLPDFRKWLESQGFRIAHSGFADKLNRCNWYAYRRSEIPARECECNDGKAMQIVIQPWLFAHPSGLPGDWESCEAEVCGEAGGLWYKLQCYSLKPAELMAKLPQLEASLIAAWNALMPSAEETGNG